MSVSSWIREVIREGVLWSFRTAPRSLRIGLSLLFSVLWCAGTVIGRGAGPEGSWDQRLLILETNRVPSLAPGEPQRDPHHLNSKLPGIGHIRRPGKVPLPRATEIAAESSRYLLACTELLVSLRTSSGL